MKVFTILSIKFLQWIFYNQIFFCEIFYNIFFTATFCYTEPFSKNFFCKENFFQGKFSSMNFFTSSVEIFIHGVFPMIPPNFVTLNPYLTVSNHDYFCKYFFKLKVFCNGILLHKFCTIYNSLLHWTLFYQLLFFQWLFYNELFVHEFFTLNFVWAVFAMIF